jgi:hypothetical protein
MRCIVSFEVEVDARTKREGASKASERLKEWLRDPEASRDVRAWIEYTPPAREIH